MLTVTKRGLVAEDNDVARARENFAAQSFVHIPRLIDAPLLSWLLEAVAEGSWDETERDGFDFEYVLADGMAMRALHVIANSAPLLSLVHAITGAGPFSWFGGRIYRHSPDAGHYDNWHSDNSDGRLVAMSINLSPRGYAGGLFQMRRRDSERLMVEFANTEPGDATFFRISDSLVHRVTEVTGSEPKTAFAGWFVAGEPTLAERLRPRRIMAP